MRRAAWNCAKKHWPIVTGQADSAQFQGWICGFEQGRPICFIQINDFHKSIGKGIFKPGKRERALPQIAGDLEPFRHSVAATVKARFGLCALGRESRPDAQTLTGQDGLFPDDRKLAGGGLCRAQKCRTDFVSEGRRCDAPKQDRNYKPSHSPTSTRYLPMSFFNASAFCARLASSNQTASTST